MNSPVLTQVLVALEGAEPSSDVLAQLSRVLDSETFELVGLLVEDEDLLQASRLPVFREISLAGEVIDTDPANLRTGMLREMQRIRAAFESAVQGQRFQSRIEVMRGRWIDSVMGAADDSALVLVSRCDRAHGMRLRAAPHFAPLLRPGRNVFIVNEPWRSGQAVVVLGGDPEAVRIGHRLAAPDKLDLVVVLPYGARPEEQLPQGTIVERVNSLSDAVIAALCRQWDARLLILKAAADGPSTMRLLDELPCSLLCLG